MAPIHFVETVRSSTMFGEISAKNVTFIIDTSGSMYPYLSAVKDHLNEVLLARSHQVRDSMFNVIQFASAVTPWADRTVRCTPKTVGIASDWINRLTCSDGTNTLDALMVAFTDPICEAVFLVSDGLPDQQPTEILRRVAMASQGRPIHAIFLTGLHSEVAAKEFLEGLAVQTLGTFHVVSITKQGAVERVEAVVTSDHSPLRIQKPVYRKQDEAGIPLTTLDNPPVGETTVYQVGQGVPSVPATSIKTTLDQTPESATLTYKSEQGGRPVKYCSVTTSMDHNPVPETVLVREPLAPRTIVKIPAATAWETIRTEPMPLQSIVVPGKPAVELFEGMKVLARRERDGYYCPATIKERLSAMRSFLVFFDKDPAGGKCQNLLQETSVYDIKAHNHIMRHPVVPGDKVLAPWEKTGYRFAPGIVLDGVEGRATGCAGDSDHLVVSFFNGKTAKVPPQTAVWIPHTEYERHKMEIQMPLTARHYVVNDMNYEKSVGGYGVSGYTIPNGQREAASLVGLPMLQQQQVGGMMYVPIVMGVEGSRVRRSAVLGDDMDSLIPGTEMTREELNVKVMKQLVENKMLEAGHEDTTKLRRAKKDKRSSLRKSVSFTKDEQGLDSGISSLRTDLDSEGEDVAEEEQLEREVEAMKKKIAQSKNEFYSLIDTGMQTMSLSDAAVGTDSSLLYNRVPRRPKSAHSSSGPRPEWKYWKRMQRPRSTHQELVGQYRDRKPEAVDDVKSQLPKKPKFVPDDKSVYTPVERSNLLHPVADNAQIKSDMAMVEWEMRRPRPRTAHVGPFRDTAMEAPREARLQPTYQEPESYVNQTVNRSSVFKPVNHNQIRSDRAMIEWEKKQPRPPPPPAQAPGKPLQKTLGTKEQIREAKEKAFIEYRRMQTIQREYTWYMKEQQAQQMKDARDERCRQFAAEVTRRDVQRQKDSEAKMQTIQEAKQAVSDTIAGRQQTLAHRNDSREQRRIEALRARNQQRLDTQRQREQDMKETMQQKEEIRRQRNEDRSQQHVERLCEKRQQEASRDLQMRNQELQRRAFFRNKEQQNQERKDIRIAMRDQSNEQYRSQVLP